MIELVLLFVLYKLALFSYSTFPYSFPVNYRIHIISGSVPAVR